MDHSEETRAPGMMRKLGDDEDVEGHALRRAGEPAGLAARADGLAARADGGDDVAGHGMVRGGAEPGSVMAPRNDGGPDDFKSARISRRRVDEGGDDVEGHLGRLQSPKSRGE